MCCGSALVLQDGGVTADGVDKPACVAQRLVKKNHNLAICTLLLTL